MNRFLLGMVASSLVVLAGAPPASAATTSTSTLSVQGNGRVFVTPDVADLSLSVTRSASTSRGALSSANRATDAVARSVRSLGIPASDIQTQGVNVYSTMKPLRRHRTRLVWTAMETLSIHITTITLTGPVIDKAVASGASEIYGPNFSFSDPSAGLMKAARAALIDARRRADDAAATMGYYVSGVQSVQLDPQNQTPVASSAPSQKSAPGSTPTPTNINPGQQEVDATVEVVYVISPNP